MGRGPESPDACLLCNMGTTTVKVGFLWAVSMMFQGGVGQGALPSDSHQSALAMEV